MEPDQRGSRTLLTAVLLTISGGFLDAYTYSVRGGVFANAQTGNIVKLGIAAAELDFTKMMFYLYPITAFALGVLLSLWIEDRTAAWPRRNVLAVEIIMMIMISFIPASEGLNIIANIMVSFLCAMQMQAFQIFRRQGIATTVATGNLRKGVECLYKGIIRKDREQIKASAQFFLIILLFVGGVILGMLVSETLQTRAVLVPAVLLAIAFIHISVVRHRYYRTHS